MKIQISTKDYGIIETEEDQIISFPEGIFAFEDIKEFVFVNMEGITMMQSVKSESPRFIVFDTAELIEDYDKNITPDVLKKLKADTIDDLTFYVIAVIPNNMRDMTVNLISPVVVNFEKRIGMQAVLENKEYTVRHRVFEDEERGA